MKAKTINNAREAEVFDFDDTLVKSKTNVIVIDNNTGKVIAKLSPAEYNNYKHEPHHTLDMSDYINPDLLATAKKLPLWKKLEKIDKEISAGSSQKTLFILTGRSYHIKEPIYRFLKSQGIENLPLENVITVGEDKGVSNTAKRKQKVLSFLTEDFDDIYFYDDGEDNVDFANELEGVTATLIK